MSIAVRPPYGRWFVEQKVSVPGGSRWIVIGMHTSKHDASAQSQDLRRSGVSSSNLRVRGVSDYRKNPARPARKRKKAARRNPASKTISLRNFTGKVRLNPDKTVSVAGVGKRGAAKKRAATKRRAARRRR